MYQVKIRYVGPGAQTLWTWAGEFPTLEAAQEYKRKRHGTDAGGFYQGWTCEVAVFQLMEVP